MRLPKFLKSKSALQQEEIDFLRAQVAQLQNYILMVAPTALTNSVPAAAPRDDSPARRMYTSEVEEDIEYQLQEGLIDAAWAEKLLEEADALNNEIELN